MITEQQIRDMEPGRELDDAIRLMLGWTKFREKEDGTFACWVTPEGKKWTYPSSGSLPRYSTDVSAAWEVVEKFNIVNIEFVEWFVGNKSVQCKIIESVAPTEEEITTEATGKTAPEAICKAALIAHLRGEDTQ
ncbi:hypothetical protein B1748_23610 [Paenibacillus sp. MY03]|uniref:BC1872 family protein n=1 Tax=Paenibacillus sp. MY03 TaxID=302980 RepID=UPI000B3D434B|nr:hypothetical protein [Paenibacillus sp. MY03]OUS72999.1 hypothetical protein B1748_23610 [Paenibacillus sp. MY03]